MRKCGQAGNAVILILIGVALFGALAAVFMRGSKSGQGNLNSQQTKLAASEILSYADSLAKAVDRLRQRGCSEGQLSFESASNTGYANASAPSNFSCHVFNTAGGALTWQSFSDYGSPYVSSRVQILGTATTASDLVFYLSGVSPSLCRRFNENLGIESAVIPADSSALSFMTTFTGTMFSGSNPPNNEDTRIANAPAACVYVSAGAYNLIYFTLIDR